MNKTLKISFSLKNTYRVNGILFSLKQIPLLKRLLPAALYKVKALKIFANILSILWEILFTFIGKFLYFVTMVCGIGILYKELPENEVFLHILLILTVIGSFVNTNLFNPTKDKYYDGRKGIYTGKLYLFHSEGRDRVFTIHSSIWFGQRCAFVVLPASAPLYRRYEVNICCYHSVGL